MSLLLKPRSKRHATTASVSRPYSTTPALLLIKSFSNSIPSRVDKLNTHLLILLRQRRAIAGVNRSLIPLGGSSLLIGCVRQRLIVESRGTKYRIYLDGSVGSTRFEQLLRRASYDVTQEQDRQSLRRAVSSASNSRKNTLIGQTNNGQESCRVTRRGQILEGIRRQRLHGE